MVNWDDMKLPPLEEVLERVEGRDSPSDIENGEVRSPWYSEVCPIAKEEGGDGEIKVKGKYDVICKYLSSVSCDLNSRVCGFVKNG